MNGLEKYDLKKATYIGDAVYVIKSNWEKGGVWLFTHDGISILDKIYLEPEVWKSLQHQMKLYKE